MFAFVDRPHLNIAGTLLGDQGECIDTKIEAGGNGRVYLGRPEALEVVRLAREHGWTSEFGMTTRVAQLEHENAVLRHQLAEFRRLASASAA